MQTSRKALRLIGRLSFDILSLLIVFGLWLGSQVYGGPLEPWVSRNLDGVFYAMAWLFVLGLLRPSAAPSRLAMATLTLCFSLELLALWHPHTLEVLRAQPAGRLLLGGAFAWLDLACYAIGVVLAAAWQSAAPGRVASPPARALAKVSDHVRPYGAML